MRSEIFIWHVVEVISDAALDDTGEVDVIPAFLQLASDACFKALRRVFYAVCVFEYFFAFFARLFVIYQDDEDVIFKRLFQDGHRPRKIRP